jgi:hypothetical protein
LIDSPEIAVVKFPPDILCWRDGMIHGSFEWIGALRVSSALPHDVCCSMADASPAMIECS